jgi:hypothetical protein
LPFPGDNALLSLTTVFRFWFAISGHPMTLSFVVGLSIFCVLFFQQLNVYLLVCHGIASAFASYVN